MKSLLLATVMAACGAVIAGPLCHHEITQYINQNRVCAEHGVEIEAFVSQIYKNEMTYDELAAKIASKCETANSTYCYDSISTPIASLCNVDESVQLMRNALKTVLTFNEFMCQNNGQNYLDFVQNDGAACYNNEEVEKCYFNGKMATNLDELTFNDENVCSFLNADWACLHHYNECDNQNVGVFYRTILESLREKFSC